MGARGWGAWCAGGGRGVLGHTAGRVRPPDPFGVVHLSR
jgi:hypothetical protein